MRPARRTVTQATSTTPVCMWAQCGQTCPNARERRRTFAEEKGAVTCWNACIHATQVGWLRKVGCTHNPEVAGSNPAPATSEGAGPVSYTHLRAHETDSYLVCR